jgi:hypothetical protein
MLKRSFILASLALCSILCQSCVSLVYSPFLHLPAAPLQQGEVQLAGGADALPQTDIGISNGAEGQIGYGITEHFALQGRAWSRYGDITGLRLDGTSLDGVITLTDPPTEKHSPMSGYRYSRFDFALIPRAMSLYGSNELGLVGSISGALWMPSFWIFRPYVATGAIAGRVVATGQYGGAGNGYGMVNNLGLTTTLNSHWSLNAEFANTIVRTTQTNEFVFYYVPSVSFSYAF